MLTSDLKLQKYISIVITCTLLNIACVHGQSGLSLYHMQGATFQGSHYNPAFMPEGKVFLGLPVISGIGINYNNRLTYDDVITRSETGTGNDLNIERAIAALKNRNYVSLEADISTFYLGFRTKSNTAISFFIRERAAARVFLPKELLNTAWKGNSALIDKDIDISGLEADVRYYREMGIGFWKHIPKKKLSLGVRFKYLTGMFNASNHRKSNGTIRTEEDNYQLAFNFSNATLNTSGVDIFDGGDIAGHLTGNANKGLGIDLGAHWYVNPDLSFAFAVNDLGYINWKENPRNFTVSDTTFSYGGVNLEDISDLEETLKDSLTGKFNDVETNLSYRTPLNTRIYGSVMYNLTKNDIVTATIANHGVVGRLRMLYGIGYTRKVGKVLTVSGNVIKHPQQGVNLGLGTTVDLGAFQLYMASDRLLGYGDVTQLTGLDFKFGINFIFGRGGKKESNRSSSGSSAGGSRSKDDRSDLKHDYGKQKDENGNRRDGIYWIIPLQKPRPIYNKRHFRDV